jgi:brefeldin A-inhibited guanine nucleotide-exchange protein
MRSKLLALHLINTLFITHVPVFLMPAPVLFTEDSTNDLEYVRFIHAVKQYLCLTLSRNTVSVVPQVYDIAVEIFCRMLVSLRSVLKVPV